MTKQLGPILVGALVAVLFVAAPTPVVAQCGDCNDVEIEGVDQHHWTEGESHQCEAKLGGHSSECQYYHLGTCSTYHAGCAPMEVPDIVEALEESDGLTELLLALGDRAELDPGTGMLAVTSCGGRLIALLDPSELQL